MTIVLAITVVVVLAVVAAGTVMTYHGLWKVWQSIPRERRRRYVHVQIVLLAVSGALLALLIAAPWGTKDTLVYVFGGLCVVAIVCGLIGAGGEGVKAFRAQRRRSKAGGEANGSTPGHAQGSEECPPA